MYDKAVKFLYEIKYKNWNFVSLSHRNCVSLIKNCLNLLVFTGLPHTQRIQGNLGNFQVEENLRETQGILIYFFNSGKLKKVMNFSKKFREVLRF